MLQLWRRHWRIENCLHRIRDVTLGEDSCCVSRGHAPQTLAAIRNVLLWLLAHENPKNRAAAMRKFSLRLENVLAAIGITGVM